ncbi:GDSL esterase/lipase At4g10955-like [Macadamia integrifolia]|uniref:GDSL esterase/lipase At4g10955-like n=1 Tax=Macadamia integrifolia TaxID=60698 RepID=UPI001C527288|nr:GDSL esterase/lipase At4g10955-like [Macadamia integrifolia]
MASDKYIFHLTGPSHLITVDWNNSHHHRSVAASLVHGVYVLEDDYQRNRKGPESLAPPWWGFFHFQLLHCLMDNNSIFGAVYEFKPPNSNFHRSIQKAPRYVIAFQGTVFRPGSFTCDLRSVILTVKNEVSVTSRFEIAIQTVQNMVAAVGASNTWLTGHSLGSTLAMLTGKNMARTGIYLQAFLFNPPFLSTPFEWIKDEKLKECIRVTRSFITAGLAIVLKDPRQRSGLEDDFVALSSWVPCLFVNPADPISSEYIGYFGNRKQMEEIGARKIGELATQNSIPNLLFGKKESEPLHVLPSANLTINLSSSSNSKLAHEIFQWWSKKVRLHSKLYQYK